MGGGGGDDTKCVGAGLPKLVLLQGEGQLSITGLSACIITTLAILGCVSEFNAQVSAQGCYIKIHLQEKPEPHLHPRLGGVYLHWCDCLPERPGHPTQD